VISSSQNFLFINVHQDECYLKTKDKFILKLMLAAMEIMVIYTTLIPPFIHLVDSIIFCLFF
jgi:hypothetical protein